MTFVEREDAIRALVGGAVEQESEFGAVRLEPRPRRRRAHHRDTGARRVRGDARREVGGRSEA